MTSNLSAAATSGTENQQREQLKQIIADRSFQTGPEMKLASGRTSTIYFNMKPTMMHPDGAQLIATLMLDAVSDETVDLVGGLEMGAVPIASAIAAISAAQNRHVQAFFVRKKAKEHGTKSLVEGLTKDESMAGKNIVVVEDVTTTGGSALKAVEALREDGATIVAVVTIVDRQEGAAEAFAAAGVPFKALLTASDFAS